MRDPGILMNQTTMTEPDSEMRSDSQAHDRTPSEGGDQPSKKRRRRRRGKDGGRDGEGIGGEGSESRREEPRESSSSDREGGDRERRRRGGRGRGKGGGGGGRDGRPMHESTDERPETQRRERRPVSREDVEHWEEIFGEKTFADLGLRSSVLKGVEAAGFTSPTKIQAEMIPAVLSGKDVLGQSRTGTGKTAAFGLPLFHLATRELPFQTIILAPTRELAIQIAQELADLGKFTPIRVSAVYGGQNIATQAEALDKGPEIIVATPGRLMDMVERGHLHLRNVKFAILDEVDRMLDIGFREDIRKILKAIKGEHQTVFVSATISDEIEKLASNYMNDPVRLETTGGSLTASLVQQHYLTVNPWEKRRMLLHLLTHEEPDLTIVFCRMKRTVDDVARYLRDKGIDAHAIHGDMYQGKRNSVMRRLRSGELGVLVASDLAARGLDVDNISHVVNYDLPDDPEIYIHRIGRTARAGRKGVAWSLVMPDQGELLTAIEKLANIHIPHLDYPDFVPGPPPERVQAERAAEEKRIEKLKEQSNRFANAPLPRAKAENDPRFPGGVVPTKLPPRSMGGRVRTTRSNKPPVSDDGDKSEKSEKKSD